MAEPTYSVVISEDAALDIISAYEYIKLQIKAEAAAQRWKSKLAAVLRKLETSPYIYAALADYPQLRQTYRKASFGNYLVIYNVKEAEKIVSVHRVLYARRNLADLL